LVENHLSLTIGMEGDIVTVHILHRNELRFKS
jgi:hypothetical protein